MNIISIAVGILAQMPQMPDAPSGEEIAAEGKEFFATLKGLSIDDAINKIANGLIDFSFKLLIAILVFYVGKFIIKKLYTMTHSIMMRRNVDASLTTFVLSLIKMVLMFVLIITVIGIIGIQTTSFLAIFASAGVAIGMALSGTLQNFAGGVLILLLKPYKVGDFIEAQGYTGTVKEIQIFHTVINTVDNKAIIVPNGGLSTGTINNFSLEEYRRVDWTIGLSYGCDYEKARELILSMLAADDRVLQQEQVAVNAIVPQESEQSVEKARAKKGFWEKIFRGRKKNNNNNEGRRIDPATGKPVMVGDAPFVGLNELGDNSINIVVRAWTHSSNYWPLYFDMNRRFYKELPQNGFSFPFPQMDVHIDSISTQS